MTRREILKTGFKVISMAVAGGFAWSVFTKSHGKALIFLRPPGALDENKFLARCIKCGLCIQACPYDTLKLAGIGSGIAAGTPYYVPRNIPCYLCKDLPCVAICPTKALDISGVSTDGKPDISKTKMGLSVVDMNNCVAYWGIQCDACYRACPFIDKALKLEYRQNERTAKHAFLLPVVDPNFCTGCGKCERACITKKAAIFVLPRELALGEVGDNYVKGWEQGADQKLQDAKTDIKIEEKKAVDYLNSGEF